MGELGSGTNFRARGWEEHCDISRYGMACTGPLRVHIQSWCHCHLKNSHHSILLMKREQGTSLPKLWRKQVAFSENRAYQTFLSLRKENTVKQPDFPNSALPWLRNNPCWILPGLEPPWAKCPMLCSWGLPGRYVAFSNSCEPGCPNHGARKFLIWEWPIRRS